MNVDKNIVKWIWFALCTVPGSSYAAKILELDDEIDELYQCVYTEEDYGDLIPDYVIESLNCKSLAYAVSVLEYCEQNDILPMHLFDKRFPKKLHIMQDPPVVLYFKGQIPDFENRVLVGVVGTRDCTEYGLTTTHDICDGLARSGAIIVSGMALGIDAAASVAALNANGFTIAVLGSGIDVIYPAENEALYYQIRRNGLLVSEYPPLMEPSKKTFPERNRIISGMSNGVLVVEAGSTSGALITADRALYQGRDLFAIPGNIDAPKSIGTNRLIQNGAKMVTDANDIIVEYQYSAAKPLVPVMKRDFERLKKEKEERKAKKGKETANRNVKDKVKAEKSKGKTTAHNTLLQDEEKLIFNVLNNQPKTYDQIAAESGLSLDIINAKITLLVIKGTVKSVPGNRYIRA